MPNVSETSSAPREWLFSSGPRGLLLSIRDWNPAGASHPPLVILHGFLEQGAAWDGVARALSSTRRVLAPDQRGHGRSGHVGGGGFYHFWDYVSDLDALVEHLGVPIDLLGHSMGGTVAALFAGTRPECVRRLVLVEGLGPPDVEEHAVTRARRFLADRRRGPTHAPLTGVEDGVQRMRNYNPNIPPDVAKELAMRTIRPHEQGHLWTWDPLHRARSPTPFQSVLFRRFLSAITAPTLLVRGGRSNFSINDEAERVACLSNACIAEIATAGHLVHHDAAEALVQLVAEHIR